MESIENRMVTSDKRLENIEVQTITINKKFYSINDKLYEKYIPLEASNERALEKIKDEIKSNNTILENRITENLVKEIGKSGKI